MTQSNHCEINAGDPNVCLAEIMETRGPERDGVLYTHFDALINPVNLALGFDRHAMRYFSEASYCQVVVDGKSRRWSQFDCGTMWSQWYANSDRWHRAWTIMGHELIDDPNNVTMGSNDAFYIPRAAYALWARLARGYAQFSIWHEIAGPTIREKISRQTNIPIMSLGCLGGCCQDLTAADALSRDFKCGHRFDLSDPATESAARKV
eukprot:CAMPEP_0171281084 /NCGR_PEP_ID=MMETSP0790-20130122/66222_1 /TAXON_ID=2925 /ORGANISM="Alexandrium catenella, Strain OF101" /LENGTH=206 /DNA_ID=CAMNT_0011750301 /DNA_START=150 /DNA_END=766 /DNA_ORIENTATION=-